MNKCESNELSGIKTHINGIDDIFNASPFDPNFDLDRSLTEKIFYSCFFVESAELMKLEAKLKILIDSIVSPAKIVFINGFPGNGKTTFIKNFIKNHTEYQNIYIDFQEKRASFSNHRNGNFNVNEDEVKFMLNRVIKYGIGNSNREKGNLLNKTFNFIYDNRSSMKDLDFISRIFFDFLNINIDADNHIDRKIIYEIMDQYNLKDAFTCFFIHLFINTITDKKKIIYFDNLDIVAIEYIKGVFIENFQSAMSSGNLLSRCEPFVDMNINFFGNYHFVFCLRDAYDVIINQHLATRASIQRLPFSVIFESEFYKKIVEKRIDVLRKLNLEGRTQNEEFILRNFPSTCQGFIEDEYFKDVFIPLYNYDYRKITDNLIHSTEKHQISDRPNERYGVRGILMYDFTDSLIDSNFLQEYLKVPPDLYKGYCHIDRVMLTVLINRGEYVRNMSEGGMSNSYEFLYLLRDMYKIYQDINQILDTIARCFLYYQDNWVNLVTIIGCNIKSRNQFIEDYKDKIPSVLDDSTANIKLSNQLNEIKIRVNPAGFIYVRYLLPHFEFYSRIAGNKEPLFEKPKEKDPSNDNYFYFESKIDKVIRLVNLHLESMKVFYNNNYIPADITPEKYSSSIYCFRHFGKKERLSKEGYFHSTRIITSHIGYLEHFRIQLLRDPDFTFHERIMINKCLVDRIETYVDFLANSHDARAIQNFLGYFRNPIELIKQSDYKDRRTKIELPKDQRI